MRHLRPLAASLMIALLVLTGQQISAAKSTGPAVMQAVLCLGGGLITVHLDADGNPVGPTHICPDATLAFLPELAGPIASHPTIALGAIPAPPLARPARLRHPRGLAPARGPPRPV